MDDFLKDAFGAPAPQETPDEEKNKFINEPYPPAPETRQTEIPPQAYYTPPRPQTPAYPPANAYQAGYAQTNTYRQAPPQTQGTYYTPPATQPATQPEAFAGMPPLEVKPKKKKKGLIVIIVIAALCAVVALYGLVNAGSKTTPADNKAKSSAAQEKNSEPVATVESSDEAVKQDAKGNLTVAGVVEKVKDSCVGITVYTEQSAYNYFYSYGNFEAPREKDGKMISGEGSGVIMGEANGKTYIMTCAHVIEDGTSFKVTLDDDSKEYDAVMVGYDGQTDIGVLMVETTGLPVATFGDSKDIDVGEDCIAIGCPGGLVFKNSVTKGIVSALDAPVASAIGYKNECIQVDAAINPGNSGGALFNMQGQVIGINSSKIASTEYEGMGFAVPSNTAVETANSLIKNGYVAGRAKLGIEYNTLGNFDSAGSIISALNEKGFEQALGTMVIRGVDDASDLKGKIKEYDMIVAVNGNTMTSVDILTSILSKSKPGDTLKLTIARIEGNSIKIFEVECKLIEAKK